MTLPFKDYLIGACVLAVIGGGIGYTLHERSVGALNEKLKNTEATAHVQLDSVASTSRTAQEAASQAQAQKLSALRLVAAGEALRAKQDSIVKESANEREAATKLLADSLASLGQLRSEVGRLVSRSRADSGAAATQIAADHRTIAGLLAVVNGDSLALTAEQRRSQSLQALTETLTREVGLLKGQKPSVFSRCGLSVGYGSTYSAGVIHAGPSVVAGCRVLP